jgi:SAM-dependent methyltransferase
MTPTKDFLNFDNSLSVRLANTPWLASLLSSLGVLDSNNKKFIEFARENGVKWATARDLPVPSSSLDIVYSSHMMEHLSQDEARAFLAEALRVLRPNGVLRLALPNVRVHVDEYIQTGDADRFIESLHMSRAPVRGIKNWLKLLLSGDRNHIWMYDGPSLVRFVTAAGFQAVEVMPPGTTKIPNPGSLDLAERQGESVYVEAIRPGP